MEALDTVPLEANDPSSWVVLLTYANTRPAESK